MGAYIREQEVIDRVRGKVRFEENPDDSNTMSMRLLRRLILEAEAEVEFDLSPRFMAPFQTYDGQAFSFLPERPTKELLRTMCELQAVMRVLETEFGRGAVKGDDYQGAIKKRYDALHDRIMKRLVNDHNQWIYPPLPGLRLGNHNTEADDGFKGMVINTSEGQDYASNQVNDPSISFYQVYTDDLYEGIL